MIVVKFVVWFKGQYMNKFHCSIAPIQNLHLNGNNACRLEGIINNALPDIAAAVICLVGPRGWLEPDWKLALIAL